MRILYAAMKYDYGKPEQGLSFEHYNFYDSFLHMGHDILYFDYMTLMQQHGREWMNRRLQEVVASENRPMPERWCPYQKLPSWSAINSQTRGSVLPTASRGWPSLK